MKNGMETPFFMALHALHGSLPFPCHPRSVVRPAGMRGQLRPSVISRSLTVAARTTRWRASPARHGSEPLISPFSAPPRLRGRSSFFGCGFAAPSSSRFSRGGVGRRRCVEQRGRQPQAVMNPRRWRSPRCLARVLRHTVGCVRLSQVDTHVRAFSGQQFRQGVSLYFASYSA